MPIRFTRIALPVGLAAARRVLALGLAAAGVCAVGWAVTEPGPRAPRLIEEVPAYAAEHGYGRFRWWQQGRALRWWRPPRPDPAGPVLVDVHHSRKQGADVRMGLEDYRYDRMFGYGRALDPARAAGVALRPLGWRWDLDGAAAVFVNLPSGDRPGFRWSEVRALDAFVRAGGGLLLVTDHSNCYFHGEMLGQLAAVFGFALPPVTVADPDRGLAAHARAWFRAEPVTAHPVTEGVRAVGMATAGAVEGLTPLLASSATAWADAWEPLRRDDSAGFTGDLERDDGEPAGPHAVVVAGEHGAGRVVVLADQNAFGETLVGYGDNARLFANALGWVARRDVAPLPPEVVTLGTGCADTSSGGWRTLQVQIARLARDACEGPTDAPAHLVLPGAEAPAGARAVVLREEVTATRPLRWARPLPGPPHALFAEEEEAVAPSGGGPSGGAAPGVIAVDARGEPVLVERDGALVLRDAALLRNAAMGGERDDPREGPPERAESHRLALRLAAWLAQGRTR